MTDLYPLLNLLLLTVILVIVLITSSKTGGCDRLKGSTLVRGLREELRLVREESAQHSRGLREEVSRSQTLANEVLVRMVNTLGDNQKGLLEGLTRATRESAEGTRREIEALSQRVVETLREIQAANETKLEAVRNTVTGQLRLLLEDQRRQEGEVVSTLNALREASRHDQERARSLLEVQFRQIQESNEKKLDEMRLTVDEKLHTTLEKRLGESFRLVSERLEAVQRGLGEMKTLADGVGDLKRVLSNVKERGTWGEYQLGAILAEILTPDQYAQNVRPREGGESVEFAVKLPGKDLDSDDPVWLPIDAKFPKEDYERLLEAVERSDAETVKAATGSLMVAVRKSAREIHDKYIAPPATTDFAIMFLPTEGLYAEVLRHPGFHDELQTRYRVLAAGPTTLSAILNSLRVGFQTLAIERRSHEVWRVLGAVKSEFGKFGAMLEKIKRQLHTTSNTIEQAQTRTRAMERSLRDVERLPEEARDLLELPDAEEGEQINSRPIPGRPGDGARIS
ncbi:MAG TPA: DNA recombination protein RmuC [Atribacteraceae bacterium]|nr:DNA recombination protein RmuC [Atribacteraceae bacterium]